MHDYFVGQVAVEDRPDEGGCLCKGGITHDGDFLDAVVIKVRGAEESFKRAGGARNLRGDGAEDGFGLLPKVRAIEEYGQSKKVRRLNRIARWDRPVAGALRTGDQFLRVRGGEKEAAVNVVLVELDGGLGEGQGLIEPLTIKGRLVQVEQTFGEKRVVA